MIALENAVLRAIGIVDIAVRCLIVSGCDSLNLTHHYERRLRGFFFLPASHPARVNGFVVNTPNRSRWPPMAAFLLFWLLCLPLRRL
jgi:hypothetical protein